MENQLLFQLGINLGAFIGQAVNFFILLLVLTFFVYRPVIKIIKERNKKLKEGLEKAEEADVRLKEIDIIGKEKIKEAENTSISIIKDTEKKAKDLDHKLAQKLEEKQLQMQKDLQANYKKQQEEVKNLVLRNAAELVKKTIVKTVELSPKDIDDALIKKAVNEIEKSE